MNLYLKSCPPERYLELVAHINTIFSGNTPDHFRQYGHIYPTPDRAEAATFASYTTLCLDADEGDRLVGSLGVFPSNLAFTKNGKTAVIRCGRIGAVSTIEPYRGRGIMTMLLKNAIAIMEREGMAISWLTGDRFRYQNYGWEIGGKALRYQVNQEYIARYAETYPALRKAGLGDMQAIHGAYRALGSGAVRDEDEWNRQLNRRNLQWLITERGSYLCAGLDEPEGVWECGFTCVEDVGMLGSYMQLTGVKKVMLSYPASGPHNMSLYKAATYFTLEPSGQMSVVLPEVVRQKLAPLGYEQAGLQAFGFDCFGQAKGAEPTLDWWLSRCDDV